MLSRFHEINRYLKTVQADGSGCDADVVAGAATVQADHILSTIRSDPPSLADATTLLEGLQGPECCFANPNIDLLAAAINRSLARYSTVGKKGGAGMQTHMVMYNYMTKEDWAVLVAERAPNDAAYRRCR